MFKTNNLEARINAKDSYCSEYEIVCWITDEDRTFCYTIAIFRPYSEGFKMETVGNRIWDERISPVDFMELSKQFMDYLTKAQF